MAVPSNWSVRHLDATFGAEVRNVDLNSLTDDAADALYNLWLERALLIFPEQFLSRAQQDHFARRFGPLEFEAAPLSNARRDGSLRRDDGTDDVVAILRGNMGWHCDSTYMPVQAKGAVFSAEIVPETGGETEWADMRAAFAALEADDQNALAALAAYHSLHYSQRQIGHDTERQGDYSGYGLHDEAPPHRPLIKVHPETGVPALAIGRHAYGVTGLDEVASRALLDRLETFACQAPRVVSHSWRAGDVVVWDNRCLMHRARPWDMTQPRVMWHTRIAGDPASEGAGQAG